MRLQSKSTIKLAMDEQGEPSWSERREIFSLCNSAPMKDSVEIIEPRYFDRLVVLRMLANDSFSVQPKLGPLHETSSDGGTSDESACFLGILVGLGESCV
jgi:hypothetical protein